MTTYSQCGQDKWLLHNVFSGIENGFFVEAGACDGVLISNSLLFANMGWRGILVEPVPALFAELRRNRPESACLPFCLWSKTNEIVDFGIDKRGRHALSCINHYMSKSAKHRQPVPRTTISLGFLLQICQAPKHMQLLSLDVDGAELEIMSTFPFDEFSFDAILIERNYRDAEQAKLLGANGYAKHISIGADDVYLPRKPKN